MKIDRALAEITVNKPKRRINESEVAGSKEEALSMVADFVKNVKKKFNDKQDQLSVLQDAAKLINFYTSEIEDSSEESLGDMDAKGGEFSPLDLDVDDSAVEGDSDDDLWGQIKSFKSSRGDK
jgi:hypothetical protein